MNSILSKEGVIVVASRLLEVTSFEAGGSRMAYVFYESGLSVNVLYGMKDGSKRTVGFKLAEGTDVPEELARRFKVARQKSKLAGLHPGESTDLHGAIPFLILTPIIYIM